ncbi:MAG: AraC family transcriptional regulator [Paludibacter sp.]|nr:AraC family transcriptional regulator [Paludibacter sp.]
MDSVKLESEFQNIVIEDDNLSFGLTINSIGCKSILPDEHIANSNKIKDFRHQFKKGKESDEFKLIYITNGVGYVRFENGSEIEISNGKILLINPHQKYSYYHLRDTEWKEYFMRFETDVSFNLLLHKLFPKDYSIIDIGFNEEMVRMFQRATDVVQHKLKSSHVYLSGMLFHILGLIILESNNKTLKKKDLQKIEQAKIIMNENVFMDISLQDVVKKLNLSYAQFRKNFKKYTGKTPGVYFGDLRLNKAKQLLLETSYSIKEIAFLLKFSSKEHFATKFRRTTGLSPKDFRLTRPEHKQTNL